MTSIVAGDGDNNSAVAKVMVLGADGKYYEAPAVVVIDAVTGLSTNGSSPGTNTSRILTAAASTNPTLAKATPGTVRTIVGYNAAAYPVYLKTHDLAVAPTVGTTPVRQTFYLPPLSPFAFDRNDYFAVGIAYSLTKAVADNDTTALVAGDILALNVDYL